MYIVAGTGCQDKLHHGECAEKLCAKDLSSGVQTLGDSFVGGEQDYKSKAVGTGFSGEIASMRLRRKIVGPRFVKRCAKTGRWDMHSLVGRERHEKCTAVGTIFSGQMSSIRLRRKNMRPRLVKNSRPGSMGHAWWTEGKPWEIALGRAALGGSETEATTGWTAGKSWEIA